MGRTRVGRARTGVAGVLSLLAYEPPAEAQRTSTPGRQALTYAQAFGTPAAGTGIDPAILRHADLVRIDAGGSRHGIRPSQRTSSSAGRTHHPKERTP